MAELMSLLDVTKLYFQAFRNQLFFVCLFFAKGEILSRKLEERVIVLEYPQLNCCLKYVLLFFPARDTILGKSYAYT